MPVKVSMAQQAWVKVPPKPQQRTKRLDPHEAKEAQCAVLRYFSCQPIESKDRVRMLSRPVSGLSGMVDVNRAPSPVSHYEGAGLMFENGSRGGGRRSRRPDRIVSEPVRAPSIYSEDIVEVIEEASTIPDDLRSRRSYRSHVSHRSHRIEPQSTLKAELGPTPIPAPVQEEIDEEDLIPVPHAMVEDYISEVRSNRSASPPPPSVASYRSRRHDDQPLMHRSHQSPQVRTASTLRHSSAPRPTLTRQDYNQSSSGYRFESAIFQPKSAANHYRNVYQNGRSVSGGQGGRWASATSALSFD